MTGLPDFQAPLSSDAVSAFGPFEQGSYAVLPQQLAVAQDADGNPKFQLDIIKRIGDFSATGQYSVLDFALNGDFRLDDALAAARSVDSSATVAPVTVNSGFARLYPTASDVVLPPDLLLPIPLGWTGSDYARWTMRLSADAGELLKGSIAGGSLLLGARLEFDVTGVAPRIPLVVAFDLAELLSWLLTGRSGRQMAASDVVTAFTAPPSSTPVKLEGDPTPEYPETLAERVIATYASLTPAAGLTDPACVLFPDPASFHGGKVLWDLSQPAAASRQWVMMLDPLSSLPAAATKNGLDSLVKEVAIAPLQLGFYDIDFTANLPQHRSGVPALGVNVQVPAHPPMRPSSISLSITLTEPDDSGSVQFRISPRETLSYSVTSFAIVVAGQSQKQYSGAPQVMSDAWVRLNAGDFPVTFAHISAASRLTALAQLAVVLTYTVNGSSIKQQFSLTPAAPDIAVGVPLGATDAWLTVSAAPSDGGTGITLPPMTLGRIFLDVMSFREYGPHVIAIQGIFNGTSAPLFVELLREDQSPDSDTPGKVALTPDKPSATWGYVAASPFRAGYRYRKSGSADLPSAPWSQVMDPFTPLSVVADGPTSATVSSDTQPSQQAAAGN